MVAHSNAISAFSWTRQTVSPLAGLLIENITDWKMTLVGVRVAEL